MHVFNGGLTLATFVSAMNDVVQSPGDGVLGIGILPNSAISSQLAALKAKHVPWVAVASPSPIGDDMIANFSSSPEIALSGKVMADWIIADAQGKANVAYFWDPTLTQHLPAKNAFVAEMGALCPGCRSACRRRASAPASAPPIRPRSSATCSATPTPTTS